MKSYRIKNQNKTKIETVTDETVKEAEERKLKKLVTQLKTEKIVNPAESSTIDEMINQLQNFKRFVYGNLKNIKYFVSRENGIYIHKQFYKHGEKQFDSIRFYTEEENEEAFKNNILNDPLI